MGTDCTKLAFEKQHAKSFFTKLRALYDGGVAVEPRHSSWVSQDALKLYEIYSISKVPRLGATRGLKRFAIVTAVTRTPRL